MENIALLQRMIWFDTEARRKRYPNATKLARQFELSPKTAQRCIDAMRDRLNAPLVYDHSKKGWAYSDDSFQLPHFQVNPEEILAILLARKLLHKTAGGIISQSIGCFMEKLLVEARSIGLDPKRIERFFSANWNGHAPVRAPIFRQVAKGLLTSRLLLFSYTSPGRDETIERIVEPYHLQYYMASWVLTAFCRVRGQWRKFYLSRMSTVRLSDESFTPKPDSEWVDLIEGAFGIFQGKETMMAVLRFSAFRARWIREQLWHPDQEMVELEDGGLELRLPVADFREIKMKILQFGADVTLVAPEALREEIETEVRKMTAVYSR